MISKYVRSLSGTICSGGVSSDYISDHLLKNCSFVLLSLVSVNRRSRSAQIYHNFQNLSGFLVARIRKNDIYVDVICGKGRGLQLMKAAREIAIEEKKSFLRLSALPGPMMVYYNYKIPESFVFSNSSCSEIDRIESLASSLKKLRNEPIKFEAVKKKLLQLLIKNGLASNKSCKSVTKCNEDGYDMILCISS